MQALAQQSSLLGSLFGLDWVVTHSCTFSLIHLFSFSGMMHLKGAGGPVLEN